MQECMHRQLQVSLAGSGLYIFWRLQILSAWRHILLHLHVFMHASGGVPSDNAMLVADRL